MKLSTFVFILFVVGFSTMISATARADFQWKGVAVEFNEQETAHIEQSTLGKIQSGECDSYQDGKNISAGTYFEAVESVSPLIELPGGAVTLVPYSSQPLRVSLKLKDADPKALYRLHSVKLVLKKRAPPLPPDTPEYYLTTEKGGVQIDVFFAMPTKEREYNATKFGNCISTKKQERNYTYSSEDMADCRAQANGIVERVKSLPLSQEVLNAHFNDLQYALKRSTCLITVPMAQIVDLY